VPRVEVTTLSRVLKSTSPDDPSAIHLYEMQEEFEDYSRPGFSVEWEGATQEGFGEGASAVAETQGASNATMQPLCQDIPTPDEALLGTAIQECIRQQQLLQENMADHVRKLAVAIAKKIICRVGDQHPDIVVEQVRIALKKIGSDSSLTIRVHPRDAEYLTARKDTILSSLDHLDRVIITGDASMSPGGCVIETDRELIDASIESQLELVELAIEEQAEG